MRFVFERGGPLGLLGRGDDEASYRIPAAPLSHMLRDPRILAFLAVRLGVNIIFGMGAVSMPGTEGSVAWKPISAVSWPGSSASHCSIRCALATAGQDIAEQESSPITSDDNLRSAVKTSGDLRIFTTALAPIRVSCASHD